jgi:hypothetical protein
MRRILQIAIRGVKGKISRVSFAHPTPPENVPESP